DSSGPEIARLSGARAVVAAAFRSVAACAGCARLVAARAVEPAHEPDDSAAASSPPQKQSKSHSRKWIQTKKRQQQHQQHDPSADRASFKAPIHQPQKLPE